MRMTADEIKESKKQLEMWLPFSEMRKHVDRLMEKLGDEDLFNQAGIGFIREAWVASVFGGKRYASMIRLFC